VPPRSMPMKRRSLSVPIHYPSSQ